MQRPSGHLNGSFSPCFSTQNKRGKRRRLVVALTGNQSRSLAIIRQKRSHANVRQPIIYFWLVMKAPATHNPFCDVRYLCKVSLSLRFFFNMASIRRRRGDRGPATVTGSNLTANLSAKSFDWHILDPVPNLASFRLKRARVSI